MIDRILLVLPLLALAACRGDDRPAAAAADADGCRWGAGVDTAGWEVVDAGPFVFKLPPGFREQVATGTDSYVGTWVSGDRALAFDYGPFTMDPRSRAAQHQRLAAQQQPHGAELLADHGLAARQRVEVHGIHGATPFGSGGRWPRLRG